MMMAAGMAAKLTLTIKVTIFEKDISKSTTLTAGGGSTGGHREPTSSALIGWCRWFIGNVVVGEN